MSIQKKKTFATYINDSILLPVVIPGNVLKRQQKTCGDTYRQL